MDVIGFLLTHRTSLDGLCQKFVDSIRRLMLMETGVTFLQWPFRLVRHLVLKYKRLLLFRNNENPSQLALFVRRNNYSPVNKDRERLIYVCWNSIPSQDNLHGEMRSGEMTEDAVERGFRSCPSSHFQLQ